MCIYGNKFKNKKRHAKLNPNDSKLGTLSVGPNLAKKSHFRALSQWWHVYDLIGLQNKKVQKDLIPIESRSRALEVGPDVVNDSRFGALLQY